MPESGKSARSRGLIAWILHLTVCSVLLLFYFLLVLRHLSTWFQGLFQHDRVEYAFFGRQVMR